MSFGFWQFFDTSSVGNQNMNEPIAPGTNPNRARYKRTSITIGLLILVFGILNVVWPGPVQIWGQLTIWAALIIVLQIIYIVLGIRERKSDFDLLSMYSETAYFFGYLATIVVLGGLAFQIDKNGKLLEDVGQLLLKGAFALISTIVGLFGMLVFLFAAQILDARGTLTEEAQGTSQAMQAEVLEFSKRSNELMDSLKSKSEEVVAQLAQLGTE